MEFELRMEKAQQEVRARDKEVRIFKQSSHVFSRVVLNYVESQVMTRKDDIGQIILRDIGSCCSNRRGLASDTGW